jgi:CMP-N-acetylneuraminic acid synthetase
MQLVGGRPLIGWSLETAVASERFVDVLVSTNDPDVAEFAGRHGGSVPWMRPAHLSTDEAGTAAVLQHALARFENAHGDVDAVALLQPTSPFRSVGTIRAAVGQYLAQDPLDIRAVVSVSPVLQHPAWCFSLAADGLAPVLGWDEMKSRKQDLAPVFALNGVIYIFPAPLVRSGGPLLQRGFRPHFIADVEESLDIDTDIELRVADVIARRRLAPDEPRADAFDGVSHDSPARI